ncbi:MAG: PAS domain S-box protein [Armatimonadetes bacterium]|nr:PAS domain S-box protein [Armatimonadota bacterium]
MSHAAEEPEHLRKELERYRLVVSDLQGRIRELEEEIRARATIAEVPTVVVTRPELRQTLARLVNNIAMIVQAEKVLVLLYQADTNDFAPLPPALGIPDEVLSGLTVPADTGIAGMVFRTGEPIVYNDALNDPRADQEFIARMRVRNGIAVPLTVKRRDEEEQIVEERIIGVLEVFNKRWEEQFSDDDLRLLQHMADNAAAIISSAQVYIQLQEERDQLEETLESIRAGLIVVSTDGNIRLMNPAACQLLGYEQHDACVGQPMARILSHPELRELFDQAFRQREPLTKELSFNEGKRVYRAETSLMFDENGNLQNVVAIIYDITEIRQLERMKTAFVSTVSHELRTPLTSIKGFISTLLDDTEGMYDDETRREFYEIIDQECDRLTRLINDLLNVSRIESGRALEMYITHVNLHEIAESVCQAQQAYTERHTIVNAVPPDFPIIEADADKVTQILDNLVGNAVKYSPDGGEVKISATDEGDYVKLEVSDQGLGVPEEHRDKIFERFQMVEDESRKAIKGTGIGLYLVRHLARAHGGDVWLEWSEVGKGSRFAVRLPKKQPTKRDEESE